MSGTVVIVVVVTASDVGVYSGAGVMVVMMRATKEGDVDYGLLRRRRRRLRRLPPRSRVE